tara:strand:+ start:394 stop:1440 length:1047 start_codon:yes stop_codon:yes gene_type:complete
MKFFLILTTGRTGSDYLNYCLDGLDNVITFSGKFKINDFFFNKFERIEKKKLISLFLKKYEFLLKENKEERIKLNINIKKFKKNFMSINKKKNFLNRKEFIINLYKSYHITIGRKIRKNFILIHHTHSVTETKRALEDFPNAKIFVTIRHPLANLKSGLINWFRYDKSKNNLNHILFYLYRVRSDLKFANRLNNRKLFIKLEEANQIKIKNQICKFLGIKFNKKIFKATVADKPWKGDALSNFKSKKGEYVDPLKNNRWASFFNKNELNLLSYVYNDYNKFGYKLENLLTKNRMFIFFSIFKKFSFEKKVMNKNVDYNYSNLKYLYLRKFYFLMIFFKLDNLFKLRGY